MSNIETIMQSLADFSAVKTIEAAARQAPGTPGLYSIHLADPDVVPEPWRSKLRLSGRRLLYVGQASGSLLVRLVEQELRHKRPATFFRGLGAVLGYRPAPGSLIGKANPNNYRFSKADTAEIVQWMADNLRVHWAELPEEELDRAERSAIMQLRPLLNTTGNPASCADLARVRAECRRVAAGRP